MHVVETFNDLRAFIPRRGPGRIARAARRRAQDRAGHHDVERLDRGVGIVSLGTLRGAVPASHIEVY
jgi:hypothetical protein